MDSQAVRWFGVKVVIWLVGKAVRLYAGKDYEARRLAGSWIAGLQSKQLGNLTLRVLAE
jgi:hypothetical protein